jgi:hypothetical protein
MRWLLIVVVVVAACGGGSPPGEAGASSSETACEAAFRAAAAVDPMADTNEDLNAAIQACTSLEEWVAASAQHPDALDGVDPESYLATRCARAELAGATLCQSLQ